ncbi:hypothetical protein ACFSSA_03090 [Luteolibacter algae]|uniref:Acyl-protein synthetase LuxE domain-containing protein n=1 Tax=Luteolibacter algae TaxID=454151 RepID=A0ABW5D4L2_9BACT
MSLKEKLLAWMRGGEASFDEMALAVFAHQFRENTAYRRYCESLGKTPGTVDSWLEIPAVPTDVFKLPEIGIRCFPADRIGGFFLTSGTTQEVKGKHEFTDLEMYRAAVLGGWRELGMPNLTCPSFFSQRASDAPHSSLVRMFEILAEDLDADWRIDGGGVLETHGFFPEAPTEVLGTSLALLRVCEQMPALELPEGSWIFETGGSKGLRKSFRAEEVRSLLSQHFGIPLSRIVNEYGMTELFSQFYKWGGEETHKGPPWVGVRVLNVETGHLAARGEIGYLEIIDLANLESVSAIRTQDLAIAAGDREFHLIGRDPAAIARGCSRGVEDVLGEAV